LLQARKSQVRMKQWDLREQPWHTWCRLTCF
jgi:hypothetical protein